MMVVVAVCVVLRRVARLRVALWRRMRLFALLLLHLRLLRRLETTLLGFETLLRLLKVALLLRFLPWLYIDIRPWAIVVAFEPLLFLWCRTVEVFRRGAVELRRAG